MIEKCSGWRLSPSRKYQSFPEYAPTAAITLTFPGVFFRNNLAKPSFPCNNRGWMLDSFSRLGLPWLWRWPWPAAWLAKSYMLVVMQVAVGLTAFITFFGCVIGDCAVWQFFYPAHHLASLKWTLHLTSCTTHALQGFNSMACVCSALLTLRFNRQELRQPGSLFYRQKRRASRIADKNLYFINFWLKVVRWVCTLLRTTIVSWRFPFCREDGGGRVRVWGFCHSDRPSSRHIATGSHDHHQQQQ